MVKILDANPKDIPAVYEIERKTYPRPWMIWVFHRILSEESDIFLVSKKKDSVIGYAIGGIDRVRRGIKTQLAGHIKNITVTENWRHRRIGSMLMEELEARLLDYGAELLYLEVRASNEVAQAMYKKRGFVVNKRVKGYYVDEDALVMVKER